MRDNYYWFLLLANEQTESLLNILKDVEKNLSAELTNRKFTNLKIVQQPSDEPQVPSSASDNVVTLENSIEGSTRSHIKLIFLRYYVSQLRKAIEDDDVGAVSLTISSLVRLIDSSIFGSCPERIAGIVSLMITFF